MNALISLVVIGVFASMLTYLAFRLLQAQASRSAGKERESVKAEVAKYDNAINLVIEKLNLMVSFDEISELDKRKAQIGEEVKVEQQKVEQLQTSLSKLQEKVDVQEAKHAELKKGREDSQRIADDIREKKEILAAEYDKLQGDLAQSQSQVSELSNGVEMDDGQKNALNDIQASLKSMLDHMNEVQEANKLATQRFMNLETQYTELEKEFRKLIDKELSGE
jgi:chromosome segregation ATPase